MKTAQAPLISAFGARMRQRRENLGLHKQVLAEAVGLSLTTIQQYENGQLPKGSHAVRLADALDCSLDWLLAGRGDCGGGIVDTAGARLMMVPVAEGRLSVVSPIVAAILGYAKDDVLTWQTPGGPRKIKIAAIPYQPEAADDFNV